jgi:hypothetical protein
LLIPPIHYMFYITLPIVNSARFIFDTAWQIKDSDKRFNKC